MTGDPTVTTRNFLTFPWFGWNLGHADPLLRNYRSALGRSSDHNRARHVFVAGTAEDVAVESKFTGIFRCDPKTFDHARNNIGTDFEVGGDETHHHVLGREFKFDCFAFFERDRIRCEHKLPGSHFDHARRGCLFRVQLAHPQERDGGQQQTTFLIDGHV